MSHPISIIRNRMEELQIDQLLVTDRVSIEYLTGSSYECGERMIVLLITASEQFLFLNALFPSPHSFDGTVIRHFDHHNPIESLAPYVKGIVGIDKSWPSHFLLSLQHLAPLNHYRSSTVLEEIMSIKEENEQEWMRIASKLNDKAMSIIASKIKAGMNETTIVGIVYSAYESLHTSISFEPIVAIQENAADPHHTSDERTLKEGDSIVIDIGCKYQNYCSDMTRTFFYGSAPSQDLYHIVAAANRAGIKAVTPGATFADVDKAARDTIIQAGYGDYFIHRTGHGIGRRVHEPFDVSSANHQVLRPGMCFSIEPGIYIPGVIGIRIEDLVLVTKNGVEVLNSYPKDLMILK